MQISKGMIGFREYQSVYHEKDIANKLRVDIDIFLNKTSKYKAVDELYDRYME